MGDALEVLLASYPTVELAEKDFTVLSEMIHKKVLLLDDAAVIETDERGVLDIVRNLHKPVRKGVLIGAVVAAITPVGLVAGLAAGGVGGKLKDLFHKGINAGDLRVFQEFLGANKVVLVLAGPPEAVEGVKDILVEALTFEKKIIATDSTDVEAVLESEAEG
jgi:uncharacterized membrane protein